MVFAYFLLALSIGCELVLLWKCLSDIDLSIGYATWGTVGTIVAPIVGYFIYKQKLTRIGVFALILIMVSIVTLNLFG